MFSLSGPIAAGVNIRYSGDDEYIIDYITTYVKKGKIHIVSSGTCGTIGQFLKTISHNTPILLSVDGKGVIHKVIENSEGNDLNKVLPDADHNYFEIQRIPVSSKLAFVSVIRKDNLNSLLNALSGSDYFIYKVFLGPVSSFALILQGTDDVYIPDYFIGVKEAEINDIKKVPGLNEEKQFSVENVSMESRFLVPFTNCLAFFSGNDNAGLDIIFTKEQKESHRFRLLFQRTGWVATLSLFFMLLLNFIIFENFSNKNRLLEAQVKANKDLLKKIVEKQDLLKTREDILSNAVFSRDPLFAYYSDRIAMRVPPEISLTRMDISPPQKNSSDKDSFHFFSDRINISGITKGATYLDSWIRSLRKFDWISDIVIRRYFDTNTEPAGFEISVILKSL